MGVGITAFLPCICPKVYIIARLEFELAYDDVAELIFYLFVLILVVFVLFLLLYVSAKFHLWPSSGDSLRPRIGMLSLVTVSPVITAFHSCPSHHVFDRLGRNCSSGTVETERLYPLRHGPRRVIKVVFFGLINPIICSPYLVFHSRIHNELVIVFN